jgi:hypothetical protein
MRTSQPPSRDATDQDSSRLEAASRILSAERDRGYNNRAVLGGLGKFVEGWPGKQSPDTPISLPLREVRLALADILNGYGDLPTQERASRIDAALDVVNRARGRVSSATMAHPPARHAR